MMMQRLMWKDKISMEPLVLAILAGIAAFNLLLVLVLPSPTDPLISIWILMPNLIALGAPAILVGTEEESGTLGWLRTLPVRWQSIADSKFLVALGSLALTWVAASAALGMLYALGARISSTSTYSASMLSISGILYHLFFSALLLICGFVTAYSFRSPVAGLIAVVPLILGISFLCTTVGRILLTGNVRGLSSGNAPSIASYLTVGAAAVVFLFCGWLFQRLMARHRLTKLQNDSVLNLIEKEPTNAYRPPIAAVGTARPSQATALFWQQSRQVGWACAAITILVGVCLIVAIQNGSLDFPVFFLVTCIGSCWLGGLVFYGDSVRSRHKFFADRGIPANKIWATRMLLPAICCALLIGLLFLVSGLAKFVKPSYPDDGVWYIALSIGLAFAAGQFVSQWVKRPILTFFAGVGYAFVIGLFLASIFRDYSPYAWMVALAIPVFLLASWRLCDRWIGSKIDFGYHWRAIAYTCLAMAIPIGILAVQRVSTIPPKMNQWRAQMMALDLRNPAVIGSASSQTTKAQILPDTFSATGDWLTDARHLESGECEALLRQELESPNTGEHLSMGELDWVLAKDSGVSDKTRELASAVIIKWTRLIREKAAAAEVSLSNLEKIEGSMNVAIQNLRVLRPSPELSEMVRMIPDAELRRESRRAALLREWKSFMKPAINPNGGFARTSFMGIRYNWGLPVVERIRREGYIDQLTKLLLEELDDLPSDYVAGMKDRERLWQEAAGYKLGGAVSAHRVGTYWTQEYEDAVEVVRKRFSIE